MILYEPRHDGIEYFHRKSGFDPVGGMRLHRCYELIFVSEGSATLSYGASSVLLEAGELALLYPGQIHGITGEGECRSIIFSPDLVSRYHQTHAELIPDSPRFLPSSINLANRLFADDVSPLAALGLLYLLLSEHDGAVSCRLRPYARGELAFRVLAYIEERFCEDISLDLLADYLGYDYNYLSGCISELFSVGFLRIVGEYRVRYACRLLTEGNLPVAEIATMVGYDCLRSFNRNFKSVTGTTPLVYRRENRA